MKRIIGLFLILISFISCQDKTGRELFFVAVKSSDGATSCKIKSDERISSRGKENITREIEVKNDTIVGLDFFTITYGSEKYRETSIFFEREEAKNALDIFVLKEESWEKYALGEEKLTDEVWKEIEEKSFIKEKLSENETKKIITLDINKL